MGKGFAELFSESLLEYGDKFVSYLKVFLFLYLIPSIIYVSVLFGLIISFIGIEGISKLASSNVDSFVMTREISKELMNLLPMSFWIIFSVLTLVMIIFNFLMNLSYLHISLSKKEKVSFREAFRVAKHYFWKYLGLVIVITVFLILLFLLLIIPGIIFMVYWIFAIYIFIGENKGVSESLRASKKIVKGHWWKVFGFLLLIVIIAFAVIGIFSFVPFVGDLVPNLVILPFIYLFFKNFYLDLRGAKVVPEKLKVVKKIVRKKAKKKTSRRKVSRKK